MGTHRTFYIRAILSNNAIFMLPPPHRIVEELRKYQNLMNINSKRLEPAIK